MNNANSAIEIETEIKCLGVDVDAARAILFGIPEVKFAPREFVRRCVVNLPDHSGPRRQWLRLREAGGISSLSLKRGTQDPFVMEEISVGIDSFEQCILLLSHLGLGFSYQENYREAFTDTRSGTVYSIDWWPGLDAFIEIEAVGKEELLRAVLMLKGTYVETTLVNVADLYALKYSVPLDWLHNECKSLTFQNYRSLLPVDGE